MVNLEKTANKHVPLRLQSKREAKLDLKPWLTPGILKCIQKKNKLFKSHFLNGNALQKIEFKNYENTLNKIKRQSKKSYLQQKFENLKGNMRKTWKLINEIIQRKSKKSRKGDKIEK